MDIVGCLAPSLSLKLNIAEWFRFNATRSEDGGDGRTDSNGGETETALDTASTDGCSRWIGDGGGDTVGSGPGDANTFNFCSSSIELRTSSGSLPYSLQGDTKWISLSERIVDSELESNSVSSMVVLSEYRVLSLSSSVHKLVVLSLLKPLENEEEERVGVLFTESMAEGGILMNGTSSSEYPF